MQAVLRLDRSSAVPVLNDTAPNIEFELLCLAVRPKPDFGRAAQILGAGIDFPRLLQLATHHGVRPRLILALSQMSWEHVPETARVSLQQFQHGHLLRMLSLSEELCRVGDVLSRDAVPFAAFKGATLAIGLYGDLSGREFNDIDIIVPEGRIPDAERSLASLGYGGSQGDAAFRRTFLAHQRQYAFERDGLDVAIDLHWAFSGVYLPFPLRPSDIWRALDYVPLGGRLMPTLSGANLALLLAGHGTKETWRSLGWVCDFSLLMERHPDLDWAGIHGRARSQGAGNAVLLACALAEELMGSVVPWPLADLVANRRIRTLTAALSSQLRMGSPASERKSYFADFDLCDRWLDKVKGSLRLAFTPTPGDYDSWPLPASLWPVYHAFRPFRLAAKAIRLLR
jgi:hypothetical protein